MRIEELKPKARRECIENYKYRVDPYGDFEGWPPGDMVYQINETIATGLFSIDEAGNWYDEEGRQI